MAKTIKNNIARRQVVLKLPISLLDKVKQKGLEDNLTNTAVIINALNFYFDQQEAIKIIPKLFELYQQDSKLSKRK